MRIAILALMVGAYASPAHAQDPPVVDSVKAAVRRMIRSDRMAIAYDSLREASDSATLWRDFVRCADTLGTRVCELTNRQAAWTIQVRMLHSDTNGNWI